MSTLYVGLEQGFVQASFNGGAGFQWSFRGAPVQSIAVDTLAPYRASAATLGEGLWRTDDAGETWERAGEGIASPYKWIAAVSRSDRPPDAGALYVGTELSALYRSSDAGATFEELPALAERPSRQEWSFPPAPDTHHLHSIALDIADPEIVLCGIEMGGVLRSTDRGKSFQQTEADPDPHTQRTHPLAPSRMYEGGGTSFVESQDHGATWQRALDGIPDEIRYFFSFEVYPGDPDTMVISAAKDPFSGHAVPLPGFDPWSTLNRRAGKAAWQEVTTGLPAREGTAMGTLVTSPAERASSRTSRSRAPSIAQRTEAHSGMSWSANGPLRRPLARWRPRRSGGGSDGGPGSRAAQARARAQDGGDESGLRPAGAAALRPAGDAATGVRHR